MTNKKGLHMKKAVTLWIMILLVAFCGCATRQAPTESMVAIQPEQTQKAQNYLIQSGDQLEIKFYYNPVLNESVVVRPDGKISLQLIDDIQAEGLEPSKLDDVLTQRYGRELKNPEITVIVKSFEGARVYVGGEVNKEGVIHLVNRMTPLQAVIDAGGFMETADMKKAIVIKKGPGNRPVPVIVNLRDALHGKKGTADYLLQHNDIVFIPKTAIAKVNKFVNQYIENLFLYRGVSLGFTYELRDRD